MANLVPLLRDLSVAAGSHREPRHDCCDKSREKDYDIDHGKKSAHILGTTANEQRTVSWLGQEHANAIFSLDPVLSLRWRQGVCGICVDPLRPLGRVKVVSLMTSRNQLFDRGRFPRSRHARDQDALHAFSSP
ncbi:hypothetical protein [Bradyrhizobium sp. Pha-3]|uniref:hypothetical protein n=1 Tax=Bradyrhizobium TaxID=374 RepID=UPI0035D41F91